MNTRAGNNQAMVALKPRDISTHLNKHVPDIWLYLVYGTDETLVRERARALGAHIVSDPQDPFNTIDIAQNDLKTHQALLIDEAGALSFTGGPRLIRLQLSGESAPASVKALIEQLENHLQKINAVTIIEAGSLSKRSSLRRLVEQAKHAAAMPCYEDGPRDLNALMTEALSEAGYKPDPAASAYLTERLALMTGGNRGLIRQEIEKLILYMGPRQPADAKTPLPIKQADIEASLCDGAGHMAGILPDLILRGRKTELSKALAHACEAGINEIACLRAIYRVFSRLHSVQTLIRDGLTQSAAMKKLKPPVFFTEEQKFRTYLSQWEISSLERALLRLSATEIEIKSTGMPAREIMERTALQLATLGARAYSAAGSPPARPSLSAK